jgi:4-hydroxy-tetrahydrodipicolinate reductase
MGRAACAAVAGDDRLALVAAVSPHHVGDIVEGLAVQADLGAFSAASCDVVVDLTNAAVARAAVPVLVRQGIDVVVGTSGLGDEDLTAFEDACAAEGAGNVVVAANFAISAVVLLRLVEIAAPFFDTVEIVELHHDGKIDAPSGFAAATAARIAAASSEWAPDPTTLESVAGARGGAGPAGIRIHSVRMRGMVAHQEVIFGAAGQTLTLRQDSYDRASFMPGLLLACARAGSRPGVTRGLEPLLDL